MKTKTLLAVILAILLASCAPASISTPTEMHIPTATLTLTPVLSMSTAAPTEMPIPTATLSLTPIPFTPAVAPTMTPSPVVEVKVADLSQTKAAADQFATVMKLAGVQADAEQIRQALSTNKMMGVDGKKYEIALTQDGYPLMIKTDDGWKTNILTQELDIGGLGLGIIYDSHNNPFATAITLSPRNDEIIKKNATVLNSTEGFYWSKIFSKPTSGSDSSKQDWRWADEYINFLKTNSIQDASPRIIDPLDDYYHVWLLDLAKNSPKDEATKKLFVDILQTNITQIVRHSEATIHSWTVNEILDDIGGMRDNVWMRTIGEDYVKIAIQAIRQEDPKAKVVLNDYYLENNPVKNRKMVDFTKQLLSAGVLKEGDIIGIEGHRSVLENNITTEQIKSAARPFIDMGLSARITELDAFDVFSNDINSQTRKADLYMKYIQAAIELNEEYKAKGKESNVVDAVVLLATTHSESWQHFQEKYKNKTIYPALFSDAGYPELAYYLIARDVLALIHR